MKLVSAALGIWLLATPGIDQSTGITSAPSREQIAQAAKAYLRDSAEFPLDVQLSVETLSSDGSNVKREKATGQYEFHGYSARAGHSSGTIRITSSGLFHPGTGIKAVGLNTFTALVLPSDIVTVAESQSGLLLIDPEHSGRIFVARIPMTADCKQFGWSSESTAPNEICGESEIAIRTRDLSPQRFSFNAGGLPVRTVVKPFGRCLLLRYTASIEFQKVTVAGDAAPFVIPKDVQVTIETDKGKLIMDAIFTPREKPPQTQ